jgi:hypothetical protein
MARILELFIEEMTGGCNMTRGCPARYLECEAKDDFGGAMLGKVLDFDKRCELSGEFMRSSSTMEMTIIVVGKNLLKLMVLVKHAADHATCQVGTSKVEFLHFERDAGGKTDHGVLGMASAPPVSVVSRGGHR